MDLAADAAEGVETATSVDADEDGHPTQSLQSEQRRAEDAVEAVANPSEDKEEEEPETGGAPRASREEEARPEGTHPDADVNKVAVEAPEEGPRALPATADDKEAPAPETADPARLTLKSRLWIQEANAKKPLRKRVNWG